LGLSHSITRDFASLAAGGDLGEQYSREGWLSRQSLLVGQLAGGV
jgi:hypothetical protein